MASGRTPPVKDAEQATKHDGNDRIVNQNADGNSKSQYSEPK
jgi:hypothetical protein